MSFVLKAFEMLKENLIQLHRGWEVCNGKGMTVCIVCEINGGQEISILISMKPIECTWFVEIRLFLN